MQHLSDIPNLIWLFAGDGPAKEELEILTKNMSRVRLLPLQPIARLNDWLNLADIHLLPQKAEAADLVLPSKLLGILASGRPLVATSTPHSELYRVASQAGYCVPPDDVLSFSDALRTLIFDPHLRSSLGRNARMTAENLFAKQLILSKFLSQIENISTQS